MKDITQIKLKYFQKFADRDCNLKQGQKCPNSHCSCMVAAQLRAYYESVIPDPFYRLGIKNFHGKDQSGNQVVQSQSLKVAKQQLCNYCWTGITAANVDSMTSLQLDKASVMQQRRVAGTNLIISSSSDGGAFSSKGKTFVASLVMKQAIKKGITGGRKYSTYDWIQFSVLKDKLKKDSDSISNQRYCDWLVVDDIGRQGMGSKNQIEYITQLIDPFFEQRLQAGLPTIFVFRFDVLKQLNTIEYGFGAAIAKIVQNKSTSKIYIA